ncbi:MAG: NAD(P)/FAD-dependent oxidoreductase [Clostridia bacterium]|nr:NAD(P)/FAD-dependent oxidoreductase [Clostridia bacterium]
MEWKTLSNLKLTLSESEEKLKRIAEKKLGGKLGSFKILKKSLDARDKKDIHHVYSIAFSAEQIHLNEEKIERISENKRPKLPVLVVGSGPAGLFCAIRLIDRGFKPILIERGDSVEEREKKIRSFILDGTLDGECNVQFGEGGAGTFSDGKLNTQTHSGWNKEVLSTFVRFGAPEEIEYLNKPHIGSDNLKKVVKNMREYILDNGGTVEFNAKLCDIAVKEGRLVSVRISKKKNGRTYEEEKAVSALVLAIGHSARDTFEMLLSRGVKMERKDFAIGARIEHLQSEISLSQYGKVHPLLPPADYKLVSHASDRAAFTFCMCPGGYVMPAASEEGGVVTNGMSNYARDGVNANSALIVQVRSSDLTGESPLAGVEFQRAIERAAFEAGGRNYFAPVQLVGDFLRGRESAAFKSVLPTYGAGEKSVSFAPMEAVLPAFICDAMKGAIEDMDRRLKGFACPDAILTAAETRTSSPVRIVRDDGLCAVGISGLYPCGEGAGYAGGITSSAADGLRVAERLFCLFNG